jgi:hypothetical protein
MRVSVLFLIAASVANAQIRRFEEHTIASDLKNGYQVVPFDINNDGKVDLIALGTGMSEVVWFENPNWQRHVLVTNLTHPINLAARNPTRRGQPEIAVAYGFSTDAVQSTGTISVLHPRDDVGQPWSLTEIDRLPTSHRLRWADIDGSGREVLINAPLTAATASAPEYKGHVPLVYYRPGEWKRKLLGDAEEGVVHGIFITDWNHDRSDAILIGSFLGVHLYRYGKNGKWSRTEITKGSPGPWPKSGTSDIAVGSLGNERFLAAIEPWHGNEVVVYRQESGVWNRQVIDNSLLDAHTVATADLDGDGHDEIIAGFRGRPYGVYIYRLDGEKWHREILDQGSMAAAACSIIDLDQDKRPDIVCIGFGTHNLKWYRNLGTR